MEIPTFNPGSILVNTATNKLYGVLVSHLHNNKIIVFRLDKNTHPIFSKFELHENIMKVGVINEYQYSNLKNALLRHYRTYNLTPTEKKMLQPLINFAFPLGIPEYNSEIELPERDMLAMDLNSKLVYGARFYLNTPVKSCYNYLDGKIVSLLERTPEGIWVKLPSNETDLTKLNNSLAFIFYRNSDIPTFSGISRITPVVTNTTNKDENSNRDDLLLDTFKKMQDEEELTSTMEFNGDKVRIIPKTMKIIFPEIYSGMIYNSKNDTFIASSDVITPELSRKLGNSLILGSRDKTGITMEMNGSDNDITYNPEDSISGTKITPEIKMSPDGDLLYENNYQMGGSGSGSGSGSGNKNIENELQDIDKEEAFYSRYSSSNNIELKQSNIDDIAGSVSILDDGSDIRKSLLNVVDNEQEYLELIHGASILLQKDEQLIKKRDVQGESYANDSDDAKSITQDTESEYDEDNFVEVIGEDEIDKQEGFDKIKIIELDELERIYPLQKGDLINYKIEKYPLLLRTKDIEDKIIKQVNTICLLKENITDEDNTIKFKPMNYKPLVEKYIKGDFTNKFLIPLVINKKKIYLEGKESKISKDDFDFQTTEVIDNFYENIEQINTLQNKKNISINNDAYINQIITAMNPTTVNEDDQLGLLFRLGNSISSNDYHKLQQDTLVIRYCDKPMKCQSYSLTAMNFDYQINLGPIGRFISDEDTPIITDDTEEYNPESDILRIDTKYKIYYPGDLIRIIGYVRPPLTYFNIQSNQRDGTLMDLYENAKKNNEVVTVNLEDINPEIIDEENEQFDITLHPNNFVLFLLPHNNVEWANLASEIDKIIPSIDDIIKIYLGNETKLTKYFTIDNIYNILEKFDYDTNTINYQLQQKIFSKNDILKVYYEKFNNRMQAQYEQLRKEKKQKDKDKKDKAKSNDNDYSDDKNFKYITNSILDDISKFYFEKYDNKGIGIDSDDIRLRWFINSFDNGRYFMKTLFMNYLKFYEEGFKLENLETELSLLKEKHAMKQQTHSTLTNSTNANNSDCSTRIGTPNIIKYPNLARLEQDNGKVAVDSEGNVIMTGDYALVDVDGSKQLYKRDIIANIDMWIKDELATLYKLIQEKKNQCIANPELKLENANMCTFDMENIQCQPNVELDVMKETIDMERNISDLQKQIDYIKHLPVLISSLDKEINQDRTILLTRLNNMKRYWKQKEELEAKLEEDIKKTISRNKHCIHFEVTDYFFKISGYGEDRYQFARSILRNFLNTDSKFDKSFHVFHQDTNDNFSYCNICNQQLLCNHFRLGISYIEDDKSINFERLVSVFATEENGAFYCRACGEFIDNTEIQDIDDFAKGEDGHRVKTREVMEDIPIIEKQKKYIDNLIDRLIDGEPSMQNEDLQQKISIFRLLKRISGLDILSVQDEVEMMNFLKSYPFITKDSILKLIIATIGKANPAILTKKMEEVYMIYLWCDIAARYLITLQTTKTPYNIRNKECSHDNEINIMGYPLIEELSELNGVNFILCLISQISLLPDYASLVQLDKTKFMKQLQKQIEEDNFVKSKLNVTRNGISDDIDFIFEFQKHETNYWKNYLPRMSQIHIEWSPEKILNEANLKEVSSKNWHKMIDVGNENMVFYSLNIIKSINNVIENSDRNAAKSIYSYCCPYKHSPDSKFEYIKYFIERDASIKDNLIRLDKTSDLMVKLYDIRRYNVNNYIYEPLYKPSQTVFKFNLEVTSDEIKSIYRKFIDIGISKGKQHIYDKYGRCILSNEKEQDLLQKTYTQRDYKIIEDAITNYNTIDIKESLRLSEEQTTIDLKTLEIKMIDKLIEKIPKLNIMNFIKDFLNKIKDNYAIIFGFKLNNSKELRKDKRDSKDEFNIHRHLSQLNAQIQTEINSLVNKLASSDKLTDKYNKIISNFGNFRELYEEYLNDHSIDEGTRFRYNKMEETIHSYIKYLNDVICQIKNRKLSNPINKGIIRPQFRDFLPYAENIKLFKMIDQFNSQIYSYSKEFRSKNMFKVLFPEMVASILHYLMVISLVNLFDSIDNSGLRNGKTDILEYNFVKKINKDDAIIDYSNDMGIDLVNNDIYLDDDGQPIDLLDNIRMKNSNNLKTIGNFIVSFIERINMTQSVYDELTNKEIRLIVTTDKQKDIENTLKTYEWLAKEGNEENRLLLQLQMRMGRVGQGDVRNYIMNQIGRDITKDEDDDYNGNIIDTGDGGEGGDDGQGQNEYGMDKYELENELPQLIALDDLEDGEMDYDFLAVGDED
jgi:hypothetical protein